MTPVREGACRRCGRCCNAMALWRIMSEDERSAFTARGVGPEDRDCRYLERLPDGTAACGIYDVRPPFCRAHPTSTADLVPGCGYRFEG